MTFLQYIQNPLGKENAVFSSRDLYKNLYTDKLSKIIVREAGDIKYKLYFNRKSGRYYIYFKIPSEVIKKFYYDTVIEFYTNDKDVAKSRSLKEYEVKFYSNDPSFVFTFAYAFNKQNLLIDDLKSKLPSKALKEKAVVKNPKMLIGYVKSLYFAFLLINRYSLFAKVTYEATGFKYSKSELLSQIMHASEKIDLRIKAAEELKKQKSIEKRKEINTKNKNRKFPGREGLSNSSKNNIRRTNFVGKVGNIKSNIPTVKKSISVKVKNKMGRRKRF